MNEKKQKIISDICPFYKEYGTCEQCNKALDIDDEPCYFECMADAIINNNYAKQSEGEWYVNYMMSKKPSKIGRIIQYTTYTCSACGKPNGRKKSKFCPNCGRKMKGGAE